MDSLTLLPEDVPGAVLRCDISIEEHPVSELQRWLECRGYKKTGKKHELILRVKNCIAAGNDSKIALGVYQGKWYDLKINRAQQAGPSRSDNNMDPQSPVSLWAKFPSLVIPKYFNKGHIYTYIVDNHVDDVDPTLENINEDDTTTTVKPLRRGSQFVDSDHISEVFDTKKDYFVKCKCQSSFQKKVKYDVEIILNNTSGAVVKGLCN
ncbi:hypothetical protein JTB14_023215 [Gonioctena quinquepunctata]|nr:hypothetical protein JTB14_023215 [Gonioctena quinquepunctata]